MVCLYGGTPSYRNSMPMYSGGTSGTGNLPEKKKKLKERVSDFFKKRLEEKAKRAVKKKEKETKRAAKKEERETKRAAKKEEKKTKKEEKMATKEAKRAEREAKKKDKNRNIKDGRKRQLPEEVLYSEDLKKSYSVQYVRLAKELKPVVDGKYLYYLRVNEKNNKMEYVKMHLQNFDINKKGLTKAISGMKDRMYNDYLIPRKEIPEDVSPVDKLMHKFQKKDELEENEKTSEKDSTNYRLFKKSSKKLVKILTRSADEDEKQERILSALCAIQASNFRNEVSEQFGAIKNGNLCFGKGAFRPNMSIDEKGNVTFKDSDEPNPILESVKKAIERRQNRDVTRSETIEPELVQIPQSQVFQVQEMIRPLTQEQISIYENVRNTVQDRLSQAQDKIPFNIDVKNDQDKITPEVTEFIYTREDGRGAMMIDKDHYFTTRAQRRLLRELDIETGEFNGREFINYEYFVNKCSERQNIEVTNDNQAEKETVTSKENEQNKHDEKNKDGIKIVGDARIPETKGKRKEVEEKIKIPERRKADEKAEEVDDKGNSVLEDVFGKNYKEQVKSYREKLKEENGKKKEENGKKKEEKGKDEI